MHSIRICTAHSLTVSHRILHMPPCNHAHPLPCNHACPPTTHAPCNHAHPWQPHTHPCQQPCTSPWQPCTPPATMHTPWQPCTPPGNHAHVLATTHAPIWQPRMPPLWTEFLTHASENITLPQLHCGR